jgi:hypothetical protein
MLSTKRLGLLLAALLTATMAFGVVSSGAWFTDSDEVAVTATSGTIDIEANPVSFAVTNLMPGVWSPRQEVSIFNTPSSTVAVKYRLTDAFGTQTVAGFYDQIMVRVTHKHCGGIDIGVVYDGLLANLMVTNATSIHPAGLPVNWTHCYIVEFKLADSAGNTFQSETATFDLVFDATQPENPGWSQ